MAAADLTRANGNGNGGAPVPVDRGLLEQLSYPGTPRFGLDGRTYPDEYSLEAQLRDPVSRMMLFDEMGNDDAIAAAKVARTQDILSANWLLQSKDKSDLGVQIKEFCEDNIYPVLDSALRWLGDGPIQYGFGALEPVFAYADRPFVTQINRGRVQRPTRVLGERKIYLRKLSHIRQRTVWTFKIDTNGDLQQMTQYVFDGQSFRQIDIAPQKLLLRVYDQQGADFWGVPPMRRCFKAWKYKSQYERINLLHHDRFGTGIPIVYQPEGGFTEKEMTDVLRWMTAIRAGATNAGTLPRNAKFEIVTANGQMSGAALDFLKLYNLQINKVFSTQQNELGTTSTGARAVGETFDQQRQGVIQADCEDIANILNPLLVQLVDINFGPQQEYPAFAPSQRLKPKATLAADLISLTTAGYVHPRVEDEVMLRDVYEMPEVDVETLTAEKADREAQAAAIATATAKTAPPPKAPASEAASEATLSASSSLVRQLAADYGEQVDGAPEPAVPGESTWRTPDYSAWEQEILRPDILTRDLDSHGSRLAGEVQDVLKEIDATLEEQACALAEQGATALAAGVKTIAVPGRLRNKLRRVMLAAAARARDFGASAVRSEIQRQLGPSGVGPQRSPRFPMIGPYAPIGESNYAARAYRAFRRFFALADAVTEKDPAQLRLEAEVDRAVEDEIGRRERSIRGAITTALSQAAAAATSVLASVVAAAGKKALESLSLGLTTQNVQSVVNVSFGVGRTEQADAINEAAAPVPDESIDDETAEPSALPSSIPPAPGDAASGGGRGGRSGLVSPNGDPIELHTKIYSAVMDLGTCDECAKWDGAEFPIDYPEDLTGVQCPNPRCEGGYARCRCVWIYVTDQEQAPNMPASKGPVPVA